MHEKGFLPMVKKYLFIIQISLLFFYIVFFKQSIFIVQLIPSIFYGITTYIIFKRSLQPSIQKKSWVFLSFLPLSFFILNISHFIATYILDLSFPPAYILYAFPNILLLCTTISFFISFSKLKHWHQTRFLMDISIILFVLLLFSVPHFNVAFHSNSTNTWILFLAGTYVVPSLIMVLLVLVILVSLHKKDISNTLFFLFLGFLTYHLSNALTIRTYFLHLSIPEIYPFNLYMISLLFFFLAASLKNNNPAHASSYDQDDIPRNFNQSTVVIILAILALFLLLAGHISLLIFSIITTSIIIYLIGIHALQNIFISKLLLQKEKLDKDALEVLIQTRTNELYLANQQLIKEATTDSLTGLTNRSHFIHLIEESITKGKPFSILFIDVTHLKIINDVHGHDVGDHILKTIASRIASKSHSLEMCSDCIRARIGGHGFALYSKSSDYSTLVSLAKHLTSFIYAPIIYEKYSFHMDVSIGIARYPKDAKDTVKLITCADISLQQARNQKTKDNYFFYSLQLTEKINRKNYITLLLKETDISNDFELYYQPKYTSDTQELIGMEALIRWNHLKEGFISPAEFIPIAEETNIIIDLSTWIFETAMRQINEWNRTYSTNLIMSINLSPLSFNCPSFIPKTQTLIQSINVLPEWIEFEITEHNAMSSMAYVKNSLIALKNLGVGLSIDDFGTGYSSLAYLKRFNVDVIKIAKELVDTIDVDPEEKLIVNAIILMAKSLGLHTIAEGVETKEQLALLKELKCDAIQGFFLGRPMPANVFEHIFTHKQASNKIQTH